MIQLQQQKIVWFYKLWQPMYTTLKSSVQNISYVQGTSKPEVDYNHRYLYIFDDLMKDATKNEDICELYTEGSHYCNIWYTVR